MTKFEAETAFFTSLPIWSCGRQYATACTESDEGYIWYHVVEQQDDDLWVSVYRAASAEDAEDVLLSFEINCTSEMLEAA